MKIILFILLFPFLSLAASLEQVEKLITEQKFQEASRLLSPMVDEAWNKKDEMTYAQLLSKDALLNLGLHGHETTVEKLKERRRPKDPLANAMISILYARALTLYHDAYSWEIRKREEIAGKEKFDLKAMTTEEIYAEAYRSFEDAWKLREKLGKYPRETLSTIITPNNYPKDVRGSLRDTISYLFSELLNDSSGWKPSFSQETYLLSLPGLLQGKLKGSTTDKTLHPVVRVTMILRDLESWHDELNEKNAALEARLQLYRVLNEHFTSDENKKALITSLAGELKKDQSTWTSMGYALLAEMQQNLNARDSRIQALKTAKKGAELFPKSPGAAKCRDIVRQIELPQFDIQGMNVDGTEKESFGISYRNLTRLYFKSVKVDFKNFIATTKDYSLRPGWRELEGLLKAAPSFTWKIDLKPTDDYKNHMHLVTPPKHAPGFYVIFASNEESFQSGVIQGIETFFSDYAFQVKSDSTENAFKVEVRNGNSGAAVKDAEVELWAADYQNGHKKLDAKKTNAAGEALFDMRSRTSGSSSYFFIVEKNGHMIGSRNPSYLYYSGPEAAQEQKSAFIYSDRSIYRPEQKVLWKIVAYKGMSGGKDFKVAPKEDVTVTLYDGNSEAVATKKVLTNAFGSASGEFVIPKGKILGSWRIQSSHGGSLGLSVEEYKRPTFLVEISDQGMEYRLNKEAIIKGSGKYYFGMPLTDGKVKWTIHRNVILPWWCFWGSFNWGGGGNSLIASGVSELQKDGSFTIKFTPKGEESLTDNEDIRYSYTVKADLTDEGGETQSTEFHATIGMTSVMGSVEGEKNFYQAGESPVMKVSRSDLSGRPLPGKGSWKLHKLKEPARTLLPADIPAPKELQKMAGKDFPDDLRLKRWAQENVKPDLYLKDWEEEKTLKTGEVTFGNGKASVTLPSLQSGVYRLELDLPDSFKNVAHASKEFIVSDGKSHFHLPAFFKLEKGTLEPGETARILALSGYDGTEMIFETFKRGKLLESKKLIAGKDPVIMEIPVKEEHRGGLSFTLRLVKDYQSLNFSQDLFVPWSNQEVEVAFSTMRDKLRPGSKETWAITVKGKKGKKIEAQEFELLAYMYDKSLDSFVQHTPPAPLSIYPGYTGYRYWDSEFGAGTLIYTNRNYFPSTSEFIPFSPDAMNFYPSYGIGGPGRRTRAMFKRGDSNAIMSDAMMERSAPAAAATLQKSSLESVPEGNGVAVSEPAKTPEIRTNFSENGFWYPHLIPGKDGSVKFEFKVPDSVTSWQVWAHAISKNLQSGSVNKETRTVKELMVRPYLPRFFRENDEATIKVVVNNSSTEAMKGTVTFDILDEAGEKSVGKDFGLSVTTQQFEVMSEGSTNLSFKVKAPVGARNVSVKVTAVAGNLSDGELRPLPVLPGRMHLAQSKFVTLKNKDKKELTFPDLLKTDDPSRVNDLFVVTLDAQLFYSVLSAVPYLVKYPYQCTEQMMNAFVSSGILSSVFNEYPEVSKMARKFSERKTRLEKWDEADPNRKLTLEESPWLSLARGGTEDEELMSVLHPDIARNTRNKYLGMLRESQTASGGFPWFSGGPPSPYMTLYLLYGFSKALEFKVDVPKPMIAKAWGYLHQHYITEVVRDMMGHDTGWEFVTFLNYVLFNYPDTSWSGNVFTEGERKAMLDFSMKHWKEHSPYLKSYLAMTLKRSRREKDAKLVWDSVMDSAKTTAEEGTHWAQEDRTWLWYNDTVETHAMALRTGSELGTKPDQLDGLVHWIFLNKKLNQWKSTRATAEVIYSLTHYLKKTKQLGVKEQLKVSMAGKDYAFSFNPDEYTGKKNQIVIPQNEVSGKLTPVVVEKSSPGIAFASATWHYSTEKLPKEAVGDFFKVSRKYFKRAATKSGMKLTPMKEGDAIEVGDEVEVQLDLSSKHPAEFVHLRDPRAAGFEPVDGVSQHKWELGIYWYEEIRDSGTNFFFERLPQGQYTFKYRIRASTAGKFRAGPATIQPLYAPEFVGFSEGHELLIK